VATSVASIPSTEVGGLALLSTSVSLMLDLATEEAFAGAVCRSTRAAPLQRDMGILVISAGAGLMVSG
jgi:hypothetical protein